MRGETKGDDMEFSLSTEPKDILCGDVGVSSPSDKFLKHKQLKSKISGAWRGSPT